MRHLISFCLYLQDKFFGSHISFLSIMFLSNIHDVYHYVHNNPYAPLIIWILISSVIHASRNVIFIKSWETVKIFLLWGRYEASCLKSCKDLHICIKMDIFIGIWNPVVKLTLVLFPLIIFPLGKIMKVPFWFCRESVGHKWHHQNCWLWTGKRSNVEASVYWLCFYKMVSFF